jgi:hypothetical protein
METFVLLRLLIAVLFVDCTRARSVTEEGSNNNHNEVAKPVRNDRADVETLELVQIVRDQ